MKFVEGMLGIDMVERISNESQNITQTQLEQLKAIFPHVFSENKIDFTKLQDTLGNIIDSRPERYNFSWAGKKDAIRLLQTSIHATLNPDIEESVNFEQTQNLFIEGDNLQVLKLLYRSYFNRIKMIYIDPPYNTGNDFVYPDDYTDPLGIYLKHTQQLSDNGDWLTSNPETSGRYHSTWLSMMYPRLFIARQLLRDDGVIFISIDDNEVHNLRLLMNEVFGEENFIANAVWQKKYVAANDARSISTTHEYILVYAKSEDWAFGLLPRTEEQRGAYKNVDNDKRGPWRASDLSARTYNSKTDYPITGPTGIEFHPPASRSWIVNKKRYQELVDDNRIWFGTNKTGRPMLKKFLSDVRQGITPDTWWHRKKVGDNKVARYELKKIFPENFFETPKPVDLLKHICIVGNTKKDDICLDFFSGSGTLAQAVLELNAQDNGQRRFILVQLPEPTPKQSVAREEGFATIADIGKERIRRVIAQMKAQNTGKLPLDMGEEDLGFRVFKLSESNFEKWPGYVGIDFEDYAQQMSVFVNPLKDRATVENTVYEVALKEGFDLACQLTKLENIGEFNHTVYRVYDPYKEQTFHVCLDGRIPSYKLVFDLNLDYDDLFICRDVALTDTTMANLALNCQLKTL